MNANSCFPIHNSTRRLVSSAILSVTLAGALASANASILSYYANLDGPSESPANGSPGTGYATADYDNVAHTLSLNVSWSGLVGATTISHIHAPTTVAFTGTASIATPTPTFPGFPVGVTSGTYRLTLDLTQTNSYNSPFFTGNGGNTPAGAETALMAAIAGGKAYWNIHTQSFPGGEIRGFLIPVPEPTSTVLFGVGALALGRKAWRRRKI